MADLAHISRVQSCWPRPMALAFQYPRLGQKPSQAQLGLAFFGLAWPSFWPQAGAGTSLETRMTRMTRRTAVTATEAPGQGSTSWGLRHNTSQALWYFTTTTSEHVYDALHKRGCLLCVGITLGNPGVSQGNPDPYLSKPIPLAKGTSGKSQMAYVPYLVLLLSGTLNHS